MEVGYWGHHPPRGDLTQRAFGLAAFDLLCNDLPFGQALRGVMQRAWEGNERGPSHSANLLHSAMEHLMLHTDWFAFDTPEQWEQSEAWQQALRTVFLNEDRRAELDKLMQEPLMAVKPQRAVVTHLLGHLLFGGKLKLLDAGGSSGHGTAALKMGLLRSIMVVRRISEGDDPVEDVEATVAANYFIGRPLDLQTEPPVVVDQQNRYAKASWIRTNTLRGREKFKPAARAQYDALDQEAETIDFYEVDLASDEAVTDLIETLQTIAKESGAEGFDIVAARTMMNGHKRWKRQRILRSLGRLLRPGGVEEITDFVNGKLEPLGHWFMDHEPFQYHVYIRHAGSRRRIHIASLDNTNNVLLLHDNNMARRGEQPYTFRDLLVGGMRWAIQSLPPPDSRPLETIAQ